MDPSSASPIARAGLIDLDRQGRLQMQNLHFRKDGAAIRITLVVIWIAATFAVAAIGLAA
jgi:hypothetical protein